MQKRPTSFTTDKPAFVKPGSDSVSKIVQGGETPKPDKLANNVPDSRGGDHKFLEPSMPKLLPGDVVIRNADGTFYNYVRPGHDVVIPGPNNTTARTWIGNHGEVFIVDRNYNQGTAVTWVVDNTSLHILPPKPPAPKKESCAAIYDPVSETTTIRKWPAGGGAPTDTGPLPGNQLDQCPA